MLHDALSQAWPPFVLVVGLLLIGLVAAEDGLFDRGGELLDRTPGPPAALFAAGVLLVAVVTAILNLDTAVVFLTPVLVLAARRRGVDEEPFLYAAVFVANAASLTLPGANLTNLIVLAEHPSSGGTFVRELALPALVAVAVTAAGLGLRFRHALAHGGQASAGTPVRDWFGPGTIAAVVAGVLVVALPDPALPVFATGVAAAAVALGRREVSAAEVVDAVAPHVLGLVFMVAVGLGVLARAWDAPGELVAGAGRLETAAVAAAASALVNNLPAAVLLSAQSVPHPHALLIGLNVGPNLAVTGSLSAFLWMKTARQVGATPTIAAYTRRGLVLAPLAILAALAVSSG